MDSMDDYKYLNDKYQLIFTPYGNDDGYFLVKKVDSTRKYTLERYYECHIENCRIAIDKVKSVHKKLRIISNALEDYKEDLEIQSHPYRNELINKNIRRLTNNKNYIIEQSGTAELLENKYPKVFTKEGYNLFIKLHSSYKSQPKPMANYSFVYQALKRDSFIHCTQVFFINFLASLNIHIVKVDSRQYGANKRYAFYEECKKSLHQ